MTTRITPILAAALLLALAPCQQAEARGPRQARSGIVATIGPASERVATLRAMIRSGMGMARINMSHANARSARRVSGAVRAAAGKEGRRVPVLFDLPGAKVRTGVVKGSALKLKTGQPFSLVSGRRVPTSGQQAHVSYRGLGKHARIGDRILLDDGAMVLRVEKATAQKVTTRVIKGGQLRSRTGVHIEGKELPFPSMTARDRRKLKIAVANGADYVGVSFVQGPKNLQAVRRALDRLGAGHVKVVAKIESLSGLKNLDRIMDHADAIMIARGDLGLAVGARKLPAVQARIAARCRARGKRFITATGFMSNMMSSRRPSRSNLRDVWRAAHQGPSHIMLNETAIGPFPVKTVRALRAALRPRLSNN